MLHTITKKRAQILALILVLSVLPIAATALAATKFITARAGGVVCIDQGVYFRIPPNSLGEDITISANIVVEREIVSASASDLMAPPSIHLRSS